MSEGRLVWLGEEERDILNDPAAFPAIDVGKVFRDIADRYQDGLTEEDMRDILHGDRGTDDWLRARRNLRSAFTQESR